MGLDTVELMIEVEQAFDVQIPDDRAGEMYTVGDVYDYIVECQSNLESSSESISPGKVCLSAATFFSIRNALASEVDIKARRLRPRASVEQTIPLKSRRAVWSKLQQSLDLKFPRLRRSGWIVTGLTVLTTAAALGVAAIVQQRFGAYLAALAALGSMGLLGLVAFMVTRPFAVHTRPEWTTFRGLSQVLLAHNYARLSRRFNTRDPDDVWQALQTMVVDQLGVQPEQVTKQALLIEDLGAG